MPHVRKRLDEVSIRFGGVVKLVRKDLGITAFGVQVFDLPPNLNGPRHDEAGTGQQELYVNLGGSGWMEVDGERVDFGPRTVIYVAPETGAPAGGRAGGFELSLRRRLARRAIPADREVRVEVPPPRRVRGRHGHRHALVAYGGKTR